MKFFIVELSSCDPPHDDMDPYSCDPIPSMKPLFLNEGNPISGSKNPMCGSQEYPVTKSPVNGWLVVGLGSTSFTTLNHPGIPLRLLLFEAYLFKVCQCTGGIFSLNRSLGNLSSYLSDDDWGVKSPPHYSIPYHPCMVYLLTFGLGVFSREDEKLWMEAWRGVLLKWKGDRIGLPWRWRRFCWPLCLNWYRLVIEASHLGLIHLALRYLPHFIRTWRLIATAIASLETRTLVNLLSF